MRKWESRNLGLLNEIICSRRSSFHLPPLRDPLKGRLKQTVQDEHEETKRDDVSLLTLLCPVHSQLSPVPRLVLNQRDWTSAQHSAPIQVLSSTTSQSAGSTAGVDISSMVQESRLVVRTTIGPLWEIPRVKVGLVLLTLFSNVQTQFLITCF